MLEGIPEDEIAAHAANPATDPAILAAIVAEHPRLAGVIRENPACYPDLANYIDTHLAQYTALPADPVPATPKLPAGPLDEGEGQQVEDMEREQWLTSTGPQPYDAGALPIPAPVPIPVPAPAPTTAGVPTPAPVGVPAPTDVPAPADAPSTFPAPPPAIPAPVGIPEPVTATPPSSNPIPAAKRGKNRRSLSARAKLRWLAIGVSAVLLLGVFGTGVWLGWTMQGEVTARRTVATAVDPAPTAPTDIDNGADPESAFEMPDLRGLTAADAKTVLADLGVLDSQIATSDQAAAGPAGIVLDQSPQFTATTYDRVALTISVPATVPDFAGRSRDEVIDELSDLGAQVEEEFSYDEKATPGSVLSISPAPGEPLPLSVKLTIAEEPAEVFLGSLDEVEGSCSTESLSVDGRTYDQSLSCYAREEAESISWLLGRSADRFQAQVGIPDTGEVDAKVRVRIIGDGVELASFVARYANPQKVDVDVKNVLRLTITTRLVNSEDYWSESVAFGNPMLIGGSAKMADLDTEEDW